MKEVFDLFLHLPDHLLLFTQQHGNLIYGLLFLIIFCETGLVVTPILPGDSLLFAIGAIAANHDSGLNVFIAAGVLLTAAILGDTTNYWIGRKLSPWMLKRFPRIIKPEHLAKTNGFFTRYGGKTIVIARFVPIVRTFAPFVAGSGEMNYGQFMLFNVIGAFLWVGTILPAGWFLGNSETVKKDFHIAVILIIFVSLLPVIIEFFKARSRAKTSSKSEKNLES